MTEECQWQKQAEKAAKSGFLIDPIPNYCEKYCKKPCMSFLNKKVELEAQIADFRNWLSAWLIEHGYEFHELGEKFLEVFGEGGQKKEPKK